jgi:hypothetical protein
MDHGLGFGAMGGGGFALLEHCFPEGQLDPKNGITTSFIPELHTSIGVLFSNICSRRQTHTKILKTLYCNV